MKQISPLKTLILIWVSVIGIGNTYAAEITRNGYGVVIFNHTDDWIRVSSFPIGTDLGDKWPDASVYQHAHSSVGTFWSQPLTKVSFVVVRKRDGARFSHTLVLRIPDPKGKPNFFGFGFIVDADGSAATAVYEFVVKGEPGIFYYDEKGNVVDPENVTALERAVLEQRDEAVRVLINSLPADYPVFRMQNCVRGAARLGNLPILQRLLENPVAQRIQGFALQEVFYTACDSQSAPEILERLLKTYKVGVDFRVRDYGHTLLFVAANAGNVKIVRWLLAHGANRNLRLKNGETAMDRTKSQEIRKLLAGE